MSHIFISYSHKDIDFTREIVQALAEKNLDTWIDWENIPKGEDWEQEIYRGIEAADAFLFLISPDTVRSQFNNKELEHALETGKRILPIVISDAELKDIPPELSKRNWIFCRDKLDSFDNAIEEILDSIHTDYEWLAFHTRLQLKALEWERRKDSSLLLWGRELREAEQRLSEVGFQKEPQPTDLQRLYVLNSEKLEIRSRRQITSSLLVGIVATIIIAVFGIIQRNYAIQSQSAAATAISNQETAAAAIHNQEATIVVVAQNQQATFQSLQETATAQEYPRTTAFFNAKISTVVAQTLQSTNQAVDQNLPLQTEINALRATVTYFEKMAHLQTSIATSNPGQTKIVSTIGSVNTPSPVQNQTSTAVVTPAATKTTEPNLLIQIYEDNKKSSLFWLLSTIASVVFMYPIGVLSLIVADWRFGSTVFSRNWLTKLASKPLLATPGIAKWALFLGYRERLLIRSEIDRVKNVYYGLPAHSSKGSKILPDDNGKNLHKEIASALGPQAPVVLVGKGGAGKTTLLARWCYLACTDQMPTELQGYNPIYVTPEFYEGDTLDAITAVLRERDGIAVEAGSVQAQLASGKHLILFDGISEIAVNQEESAQEVLRFARNADYKNCRFLLATRPEISIDHDIPVFYLESLPSEFIKTLLQQYAQEQDRPKIRQQLRRFGEMPLDPLLLHMVLAQSKDATLSDTRSHLFESYFRKLLRADNDTTWNGWRTILEEFARWSFIETGNRGIGINHEQLIDRMKEEFDISPAKSSKTLLTRVQEYYDLPVKNEFDILKKLKAVGILVETRKWRFGQDPFEEYFAANFILSKLERNDILPDLFPWTASDSQIISFSNVIEFVGEMAEPDIISRLINSSLPSPWKQLLKSNQS